MSFLFNLKKCILFPYQERDLGDEYGWKQVHGDVFRSASYPLLFSSLIGTGYQLAVVGFLVIVMSIIGDLYTEYVTIHNLSIVHFFKIAITILTKLPFFSPFFSAMVNFVKSFWMDVNK